MSLTPEQDADWRKQLEAMGVQTARDHLDKGLISSGYISATYNWLGDKDREAEERASASLSAQIAEMRRASMAAERQATAAERANTRATIALTIAIASMIITVVGIVVTHWDSAK
jgi:hypothetical protein